MDGRLGPGVVVHVAVALDAVHGPAGRRVVGRLTGRVRAEVPRRHHAGQPPDPGGAGDVGGGEQRLQPRVDAVGDLRAVDPGRQPTVVRSAGGEHPRVEDRGVPGGGRDQRRVAQGHRRAGERRRHLRAPAVPDRSRQPPGPHGTERPAARVAATQGGHGRRELDQRVPRRGGGRPGPDVRREAEHRLCGRVAAVDNQPGRRLLAVDVPELPVTRQRLALQGRDAQVQPVLEKAGEDGVGATEGRVALTQRPDRAGQPVGLGAVRRVGLLVNDGARVQGAVRLHPEHDVAGVGAGRGLEVPHRAQQVEGLGPTRGLAGLLPVPQVDDRRAGDVVGVERALPPDVRRRRRRLRRRSGRSARRRGGRRRSTGRRAAGPAGTSCGSAWVGGVTVVLRKFRWAKLVSGTAADAGDVACPTTSTEQTRASTRAPTVRTRRGAGFLVGAVC